MLPSPTHQGDPPTFKFFPELEGIGMVSRVLTSNCGKAGARIGRHGWASLGCHPFDTRRFRMQRISIVPHGCGLFDTGDDSLKRGTANAAA